MNSPRCLSAFRVRKRHKGGFSLTEIALALMVVGVGMVAVLGIFPVALELNQDATGNARMALLGEEILHRLRVAALDPEIDWDNPTDNARGIDRGAIDNNLLNIALPVPERWASLPAGVSALDATRNITPYPIDHPDYREKSYQLVWYFDARAPEIDSHNIGVRVTLFKPSLASRGDTRDVEISLWSDGLYDEQPPYRRRSNYKPPPNEGGASRFRKTTADPDYRVFGSIARSPVPLY